MLIFFVKGGDKHNTVSQFVAIQNLQSTDK